MGKNWQPMDTAPRDGTVIEIRNSYGVAPWYGLFRWSDKVLGLHIKENSDGSRSDSIEEISCKPCWAKEGQMGSVSADSERYLSWRPYEGRSAAYADPTGGAQNTPEYWGGR